MKIKKIVATTTLSAPGPFKGFLNCTPEAREMLFYPYEFRVIETFVPYLEGVWT